MVSRMFFLPLHNKEEKVFSIIKLLVQIRVKNTSYLVVLAVRCKVYTCTLSVHTEHTGRTALN